MPRPGIVRADTIDLQDQAHPSAKDHSSAPSGIAKPGSIAPSQANALMNAAQEQVHDQHDLMTVHNGIGGSNDSYIPDSISPYNHDPHYSHGNHNGMDDDMHDDDELDEDMLDKMSSSPSISDEDIDFEFVYALHTFIATVEGQANATKGDTMVLLDDSNSYWWLVRVVKDSTIGYLPAEHIETPSERLARLNKHRNVDLSTPMLGDNQEKSKNILKKAIRRRQAKTVQFAPPQYFEAEEIEYSSDEEDIEDRYYRDDDEDGAVTDDEETSTSTTKPGAVVATSKSIDDDEITPIDAPDTVEQSKASVEQVKEKEKEREPTKVTSKPLAKPETRVESAEIFDSGIADGSRTENKVAKTNTLKRPDSEMFTNQDFEPRRITITPKIARDDANTNTAPNITPVKQKNSFDRRREDALSPPPATKGEKKKEKKSILGSLFKKRKNNSKDDEIDDFLHSAEKKSSESLRDDSSSGRPGSSRSGGGSFEQSSPQIQQQAVRTQQQQQNEKLLQNPLQRKSPETSKPANFGVRTIDSVKEDEEEDENPFGLKFATRQQPMDQQQSSIVSTSHESSPKFEQDVTPISSTATLPKMETEVSPVFPQPSTSKPGPPSAEVTPILTSIHSVDARTEGYYSETPEDLTPHEPPSLIPDNGSGSEDNNPHDISPVDATYPDTPVAHPGSPSSLVWSEAALNAYLDDQNEDIRDFLIVVNHKTERPALKSHPEITPLFADANTKLQDITSRLDSMLDQWMKARR